MHKFIGMCRSLSKHSGLVVCVPLFIECFVCSLMQWKENSRLTSAGNSEEIDSLKEQLLNKDKWCKARVEQVRARMQTTGSFFFVSQCMFLLLIFLPIRLGILPESSRVPGCNVYGRAAA